MNRELSFAPINNLLATIILLSAAFFTGAQPLLAQGTKQPTGPGKVIEPPSIPGSRDGGPFEPLGVRLGGFLLHPFLDLELLNDDNIFARSDAIESDTITVIRPGFNLGSTWNTHELSVYADTALGRYSDFDSEDYDNWVLGAEGRIDVDRSRHLTLGIELSGEKEDRSDPDALPFADNRPTDTDKESISASWFQAFNRTYYRLGGQIGSLDFNNPDADVDDRDRDFNNLFGEVGYEFSPGYSAFVRFETEAIDYDILDDQGRDRDSGGESLTGGVSFDITDILEGSVFAGYRDRSFDDPVLSDISGGLIGADVSWRLTGLTTLNFDANRTIEETTIEGSSGYYRTRFGVDAEHELYRNFILSAGIGFYDDDYEGSDRSDDGLNWNIGGTYISNRWLRVQFEFAHEDRDSTAVDVITSDYDRDVFRLFVRGIR